MCVCFFHPECDCASGHCDMHTGECLPEAAMVNPCNISKRAWLEIKDISVHRKQLFFLCWTDVMLGKLHRK